MYDNQLIFTHQSEEVARKIKVRANVLARMMTDWGCDWKTLRITYVAKCRAKTEYTAPAWYPRKSETSLEKLETAQMAASRRIAGLVITTPKNAILMECGLPPIRTRIRQLANKAFEKTVRLSGSNPRYAVTTIKTKGQRKRSEAAPGKTGRRWLDTSTRNFFHSKLRRVDKSATEGLTKSQQIFERVEPEKSEDWR